MSDLAGRTDRLTDQLRAFEPTSDEAAARVLMLALARSSGDPLSRHHFDPGHFTVGAFVVADDHVLLVHHRRMGIWLEPGGHIDPGDATFEEAAARELLEETGIAGVLEGGLFDIDAHLIPAGRGEPAHRHFNLGYRFSAARLVPVPEPDEVHDVRWVRLDAVGALNTDAAMMRAVGKLQSLRDMT